MTVYNFDNIYYISVSSTGNSKKVKGDNFSKKFWANNPVIFNNGTSNANKENGKISLTKSNEIHENKNSLNCTSESKFSNSNNNQKDDLSTQMSFHKMDDIRHTNEAAGNYLEKNTTSSNIQQNSKNPVEKSYLPNNKYKNPDFFPLANVYDKSINLNSNLTNSQAKNKRNMHSTSNIIMPVTNDLTMTNLQTSIVVNQSVASVPVANGDQTKILDKNNVLMREKMFTNVSSPGSSSSNNIFVSNLLKRT